MGERVIGGSIELERDKGRAGRKVRTKVRGREKGEGERKAERSWPVCPIFFLFLPSHWSNNVSFLDTDGGREGVCVFVDCGLWSEGRQQARRCSMCD